MAHIHCFVERQLAQPGILHKLLALGLLGTALSHISLTELPEVGRGGSLALGLTSPLTTQSFPCKSVAAGVRLCISDQRAAGALWWL